MGNAKSFYIIYLAVSIVFLFWIQPQVFADQREVANKAIENELNNSLGMPMLKGDIWQKMTHDSKVAFVWGLGHVVTIESALMDEYPELKRESFVAKTVEGMGNMPMNDVVEKIDGYYKANPGDIDIPVTSVIWKIIIKPNINTGIAGYPLQK